MSEMIISPSVTTGIEDDITRLEYVCSRYITDRKNKYTSFIAEKYLEWDESECWKILTIASGIWGIVEQAYIDGVGEPITESYTQVERLIRNYTATGKMVVEVVGEGADRTIQVVPSEEFAIVDDIPRRIVFLHDDIDDRNYIFMKSYYVGQNTNQLFLLDQGQKELGDEVKLTRLAETREFPELEVTKLDTLSIFYHIDECGVFERIESLVHAIERKMTAVDTELIHFVKTKTILKGSDLKISDFENNDTLVLSDPQGTIEVVKYTNTLIKESWDVIDRQLSFVSGITKVPKDQFGIDDTSALGIEAQKAKKSAYIKRIESLRDYLTELYTEAYLAIGEEFVVRWDNILTEDRLALLNELQKAMDLGLITKKQAIMDYNDITDDEADDIILATEEEISEEVLPTNEE